MDSLADETRRGDTTAFDVRDAHRTVGARPSQGEAGVVHGQARHGRWRHAAGSVRVNYVDTAVVCAAARGISLHADSLFLRW